MKAHNCLDFEDFRNHEPPMRIVAQPLPKGWCWEIECAAACPNVCSLEITNCPFCGDELGVG